MPEPCRSELERTRNLLEATWEASKTAGPIGRSAGSAVQNGGPANLEDRFHKRAVPYHPLNPTG
jgi:hypothetical protein